MALSITLILALSLYLGASSLVSGSTAVEASKYQVKIKYSGDHSEIEGPFCSGTIINSNWILTAAFCTPEEPLALEDCKILLSGNSNDTLEAVNMVVHPKYDEYVNSGYNYNFALIEVKNSSGKSTIGTGEAEIGSAIATGYGLRLRQFGDHELNKVQVSILSSNDCRKVHSYEPEDSLFCGGNNGDCQLDFGSPLVQDDNLVGIFIGSWDNDCHSSNPGVYGRVAHVQSWIQNVTQQKSANDAMHLN